MSLEHFSAPPLKMQPPRQRFDPVTSGAAVLHHNHLITASSCGENCPSYKLSSLYWLKMVYRNVASIYFITGNILYQGLSVYSSLNVTKLHLARKWVCYSHKFVIKAIPNTLTIIRLLFIYFVITDISLYPCSLYGSLSVSRVGLEWYVVQPGYNEIDEFLEKFVMKRIFLYAGSVRKFGK